MTEDEARRIEFVRAIELEDREATLFTKEDRAAADASGRQAAGSLKSGRFAKAFLIARANFATARLTTRHKGLARLLQRTRWSGWIGIGLAAAGLVAGFSANEFGTGQRMDLLAAPLLGTIGWNLLVYAWIFGATIAGLVSGNRLPDPLALGIARLSGVGRRISDPSSAIERAARNFEERWSDVTSPIDAARARRSLHLSAALFAVGLIAGIYLRALVIEYRAGWESTFLDPVAVRAVLVALLGPASSVSGVAIPPLADINAMRWTGAEISGVNAAPWIHLYMLTITGLVIVPRLALASWQSLRAFQLALSLSVAGRDDFYIRRLLRASGAAPGRARVIPYAYHPGEETRRRLIATLKHVLGDGAEVRIEEPIEYGGEENWITTRAIDPDDDYCVLLFTLSSTPEAENHGYLAQIVAQRLKDHGNGTVLGALIDESPYRVHFGGQSGLDERIATRLAAWRSVFAPAGIVPLGVDLSDIADDRLAQRIEANLQADLDLVR
ncbi:hypothetical protein A9995_07120 [Erythrobacter sp. QSSC1-22B]|uniref:DUF2868 domain-containing protein n=1 Tax=Erythrobacter sp. QSSC1-22B TaxID=1860125 RepID=UPI000805F664|nr:DUF2868 domain-containing protein [Erythrobacter sp. QSSC1-22B]OBX19515.1 hypothetical protein A9995_07120 [Erythrobacter sp. QSSC1-22B]